MLTIVHPAQVPGAELVRDAEKVVPLLMCKNDFVFELSEFHDFRAANEGCNLDDYISHKFVFCVLEFFVLRFCQRFAFLLSCRCE